jgi:hypothetical protein
MIRRDRYVEQECEVGDADRRRGRPREAASQPIECDSTDVDKKERRSQAGGMPTRRETLEVDALLADLDRAREVLESAERRARTYLVRRGVIDQTRRDLTSLLRECVPAQDADPAQRRTRGRS